MIDICPSYLRLRIDKNLRKSVRRKERCLECSFHCYALFYRNKTDRDPHAKRPLFTSMLGE
jgi:hypothetical protein